MPSGNINHAVQHSSAEYFAIFDADFVPQRSFLMRTLGFFADESIGIVQVRMLSIITIRCR